MIKTIRLCGWPASRGARGTSKVSEQAGKKSGPIMHARLGRGGKIVHSNIGVGDLLRGESEEQKNRSQTLSEVELGWPLVDKNQQRKSGGGGKSCPKKGVVLKEKTRGRPGNSAMIR